MSEFKQIFERGEKNPFGQFFIGQSYLQYLNEKDVPIINVTFEPGCRNNWHIHTADQGGGQILIVTAGRGWYQAWGEEPVELIPGKVVHIPTGVKHWHGAAADSWLEHVALELPGENGGTEWLEEVSDAEYEKVNKAE